MGLLRAEEASSLGLGKPPSPQRRGHNWHTVASGGGSAGLGLCAGGSQHTQTCSPGKAPPRRGLLGRPQLSHCPHSDSFPCRVHRKGQGSSWWPEGSPCHGPSDRHTRGTGDSALFFCSCLQSQQVTKACLRLGLASCPNCPRTAAAGSGRRQRPARRKHGSGQWASRGRGCVSLRLRTGAKGSNTLNLSQTGIYRKEVVCRKRDYFSKLKKVETLRNGSTQEITDEYFTFPVR